MLHMGPNSNFVALEAPKQVKMAMSKRKKKLAVTYLFNDLKSITDAVTFCC